MKFKVTQVQWHSRRTVPASVFRSEGKNKTPKSQLGRLEDRPDCRDPTLRVQAHQFPSTLDQNPCLIQEGGEQAENSSTFSVFSLDAAWAWHLQFRMASWSPTGPGSTKHRGRQEHLLPSDLGTAVATSLRCVPRSSHSCLKAHSLACRNMLYLGLHLRPYGLLAATPSRACLQNAEDQMEQTIPVWARLISSCTIQGLPAERQGPDGVDNTCVSLADLRCWGLGVKKMADYKHLNNNPTTHADSFPPGMVIGNINSLQSRTELDSFSPPTPKKRKSND